MNLLQEIFGHFTSSRVEALGKMLGGDSGSAEKAIGAGLPAILGGLISRATGEPGAASVLKSMRDLKPDTDIAGVLDRFLKPDSAKAAEASHSSLLSSILGDKAGGAASAVAAFSGLSPEVARKVLGLAGPLVMGALAKGEPKEGFSSSGLMGFLSDQKQHLALLAPPGIASFLSTLPGMGGFAELASSAVGGRIKKTTYVARTETVSALSAASAALPSHVDATPARGDSTPWLVLAALAIPMTLLGARACQTERERAAPSRPIAAVEAPAPAVSAPTVVAPAPTPQAAAPAAGLERVDLGNGQTLDVKPDSIGWSLFQYLKSSDAAPRTFVFDNLNFESGSDRLTPDSRATVEAAAAVLKAFPKVELTVEGHTDNAGATAANLALSTGRAQTVGALLTAEGVGANRIKVAGKGEGEPIASNGTARGRATNRRVELTVTKK